MPSKDVEYTVGQRCWEITGSRHGVTGIATTKVAKVTKTQIRTENGNSYMRSSMRLRGSDSYHDRISFDAEECERIRSAVTHKRAAYRTGALLREAAGLAPTDWDNRCRALEALRPGTLEELEAMASALLERLRSCLKTSS